MAFEDSSFVSGRSLAAYLHSSVGSAVFDTAGIGFGQLQPVFPRAPTARLEKLMRGVGPGEYDVPSSIGPQSDSRRPTSPRYSMGGASKEQEAKKFLSQAFQETLGSTTTSQVSPRSYLAHSDPIARPASSVQRTVQTPKFGNEPRFVNTKLRISNQHDRITLGSESPGPGAYSPRQGRVRDPPPLPDRHATVRDMYVSRWRARTTSAQNEEGSVVEDKAMAVTAPARSKTTPANVRPRRKQRPGRSPRVVRARDHGSRASGGPHGKANVNTPVKPAAQSSREGTDPNDNPYEVQLEDFSSPSHLMEDSWEFSGSDPMWTPVRTAGRMGQGHASSITSDLQRAFKKAEAAARRVDAQARAVGGKQNEVEEGDDSDNEESSNEEPKQKKTVEIQDTEAKRAQILKEAEERKERVTDPLTGEIIPTWMMEEDGAKKFMAALSNKPTSPRSRKGSRSSYRSRSHSPRPSTMASFRATKQQLPAEAVSYSFGVAEKLPWYSSDVPGPGAYNPQPPRPTVNKSRKPPKSALYRNKRVVVGAHPAHIADTLRGQDSPGPLYYPDNIGFGKGVHRQQTHGIVIQGKPMNPDYLREALAKGEIPSPGAYFQDTIAVAAQTTSRSAPQRAATFSPRERMQDFPLNAATEIKRSRGIPGPGQYSVHAPRTKGSSFPLSRRFNLKEHQPHVGH